MGKKREDNLVKKDVVHIRREGGAEKGFGFRVSRVRPVTQGGP